MHFEIAQQGQKVSLLVDAGQKSSVAIRESFTQKSVVNARIIHLSVLLLLLSIICLSFIQDNTYGRLTPRVLCRDQHSKW